MGGKLKKNKNKRSGKWRRAETKERMKGRDEGGKESRIAK